MLPREPLLDDLAPVDEPQRDDDRGGHGQRAQQNAARRFHERGEEGAVRASIHEHGEPANHYNVS